MHDDTFAAPFSNLTCYLLPYSPLYLTVKSIFQLSSGSSINCDTAILSFLSPLLGGKV